MKAKFEKVVLTKAQIAILKPGDVLLFKVESYTGKTKEIQAALTGAKKKLQKEFKKFGVKVCLYMGMEAPLILRQSK